MLTDIQIRQAKSACKLADSHRLDTQRMRLAAEKAGWTQWVPERALQGRGLKKVPDAAAIDTRGHLVAIEIERH